jgi:hypothetical protein
MVKNIITYLLTAVLVSSCNSPSEQSTEPSPIAKKYYADPVSSIIQCDLKDWDGSNSYLYYNEKNIEVRIFYSNNLIKKFNGKPAYVFIDSVLIDSIEIQTKIRFVLDSIYIPFEISDEHHFIITPNEDREYGLGLTELELRLQFYKNGSKKAERMFKL